MGEEMCRKQGAGAVTEESGSTGLEPPCDSRWGDEKKCKMGVESLTEGGLWKKVWIRAEVEIKSRRDWQRGWYRPVESSEMGVKQGEEKTCCSCHHCWRVSKDDCISSNGRYRCTSWKEWYQNVLFQRTNTHALFSVVTHHLSAFSLSSVLLSSTSSFIPLFVHWGVTNWWIGGLKEAQMEKQMEGVIGHVYALYLRFPPPFSFPPSIVPPPHPFSLL